MFNELSIRTQIISFILVFTILSLAINSAISVASLNSLRDNTRDMTTEAMDEQVTRNLRLSSTEAAQVIEEKLERSKAGIQAMSIFTEELFAEDSQFGFKESYVELEFRNSYVNFTIDNGSTEVLPPGIYYNSSYNERYVSNECSSYFLPNTVNNSDYEANMTPAISNTINRSAFLDIFFKPFMDNNPNFVKLYAGFEVGHIFRLYPGQYRDNRSYDPTQRSWYRDAKATPDEVIITSPYIDAGGMGWMISMAKAVTDDNGTFIGVVSGDIVISDIQKNVLDVTFLETGYAALIEEKDDNWTVVAHPEWDYINSNHTVNITDVENNTGKYTFSQQVNLSAEEVEVDTYTRNGKMHYCVHAPILDRFVMLISVPYAEAVRVVDRIDTNIEEAQQLFRIAMLGLSVLVLGLVLVIGIWLGNTIAKPIDNLSRMALELSQHAKRPRDHEDVKKEGEDEIAILTRSFSKMIDGLWY